MPADLQTIRDRERRYRARQRLAILAGTLSNAREQARTLDGLAPARELVLIREHLRTCTVLADNIRHNARNHDSSEAR